MNGFSECGCNDGRSQSEWRVLVPPLAVDVLNEHVHVPEVPVGRQLQELITEIVWFFKQLNHINTNVNSLCISTMYFKSKLLQMRRRYQPGILKIDHFTTALAVDTVMKTQLANSHTFGT